MEIQNIVGVWWSQLQTWVEAFIQGLPQLIAAIAVMTFFWFLAKTAKQGAEKLFDRVDAPVTIERLVASLVKIAVILLGVMIALGILNLDKTVTSMLAGLGIVGVALGFAFQDIAANFISGLILVIRRPFRVGDVIEVADQMGIVETIELRSTIIKSFQGQVIHIPNQTIFTNVIVNYSELGSQRIDLACGVSYDDDLEAVQYETIQLLKKFHYSDDEPQPAVHFEEFGDSSINFMIRFWIDYKFQDDFLSARSEAIKAITELYRDKGFTIPFPIRAIDVDQQQARTAFKK
jgi:small conductance mechanosensitive channel